MTKHLGSSLTQLGTAFPKVTIMVGVCVKGRRGSTPIAQRKELVQRWGGGPAKLLKEGLEYSLLLPRRVLRARAQRLAHHVSYCNRAAPWQIEPRAWSLEPGPEIQNRKGSHLALSERTTSSTSGGTQTCGEGKARKDPERKCLELLEKAPQSSHQSPFLLTWGWRLRLVIVCPITWKVTVSSEPREFASFHMQRVPLSTPTAHTHTLTHSLTHPLSWKRPGKRQARTLSGLMENRYTFTTWPTLCKTKEKTRQGGMSLGAA